MKSSLIIPIVLLVMLVFYSCKKEEETSDMNIIFLHHSVGSIIYNGTTPSLLTRAARKIDNRLAELTSPKPLLPILIDEYNEKHGKNYRIIEKIFPKETPYGWVNNPYDYYNIWVKNAGETPYMEEPTLEMLTKDYQVIIFKHCYPVSNIQEDLDSVDINSNVKTISNYKLQYAALRDKLHEFPDTKFILFTGAAQVKSNVSEEAAKRAGEFFEWVIDEWDLPGDNIFIWDLYSLQTEGGLFLKDEYAVSSINSHPNKYFASKAVKLLFKRIIDIVENQGAGTQLTGKRD